MTILLTSLFHFILAVSGWQPDLLHPAFTCSKSTVKITRQSVKSANDVVFTHCSSFSILDFEQLNASWDTAHLLDTCWTRHFYIKFQCHLLCYLNVHFDSFAFIDSIEIISYHNHQHFPEDTISKKLPAKSKELFLPMRHGYTLPKTNLVFFVTQRTLLS